MMLRSIGLRVTLALGFLVAPRTAEAQPVGEVYRISYLARIVSDAVCALPGPRGVPAGAARLGIRRRSEPAHRVPLKRSNAGGDP
jgi:hypothetical protein